MTRWWLLVVAPLAACVQINTVANLQKLPLSDDHLRDVDRIIAAEVKDNPRPYWIDSAVRPIENAVAASDSTIPAVCLGSHERTDYTVTISAPDPERVYAQDQRVYAVLVQGQSTLVKHAGQLLALLRVTDTEYSYKDAYKELSLRAIVAFERLVDHQRFLLGELKASGCLQEDAVIRYRWSDPAKAAYEGMIRNVKVMNDTVTDLAALASTSFTKNSTPLMQRKNYVPRVEFLNFLHQIYGEQSGPAEQQCAQQSAAAKPNPVYAYACGYLYERIGRDSDAKSLYDKMRVLSSDNLEYVAKAKKRSSYIDECAQPLGSTSACQIQVEMP